MRLQGDVVVVTGASRGIGRAVAEACVREGAAVALIGRSTATLEAAAGSIGGRTLCVAADVTVEGDVARAAEAIRARFGRVDALVNNAGSGESAPFGRMDRALWDRMLAINATSAFLVTRALLSDLLQAKGRVVMVASKAGLVGAAYVAAYCAGKHAMIGLMRSLAAEFGEKGLRVNAVCPGYVDTPMTDKSVENIVAKTGRSRDEARDVLAQMNPQRRLLRAEEIAEAVIPLVARGTARNGEAIDL